MICVLQRDKQDLFLRIFFNVKNVKSYYSLKKSYNLILILISLLIFIVRRAINAVLPVVFNELSFILELTLP